MSAVTATLRGRVAAERLMLDVCTVRRRGPEATDPVTGVVTPTWTVVYTGPCKVQESSGFAGAGRSPDAGEHTYTVQSYLLHLPMSVTGVLQGDVAELTTAVLDAALIGRLFRVAEEFAKSFATARRFRVEETTA